MQRRWIGLGVIGIALLGLVTAGMLHWRHGRIFPSTEDAYVSGDVTAVASRVAGTLQDVLVDEHAVVEEGQVIARLDARDFDAALADADAGLAKAQATLTLDEAQIAGAEAQIAVAHSQAELAHADLDRYTALQRSGSAPERQYEQAVSSSGVADAQLRVAEKALTAARARLAVDQQGLAKSQAERDHAALQRSYCTITAPCTGMIADKSAQPGQVISPGQPLCRIASLKGNHIWVDANFKETQLQRIRPGQPVEIRVDADKAHIYHGTVAALSAGTGAAFSLLPPENASGNWVKVVQRLPVRIALDAGNDAVPRLRLGLSARVTVDTRSPEDR
jgi:membrane fusion protein (multidrug efflux system)